jgi:ribulose-5-phosphate 4-epimerase/fuculose-1-phosphate aldolase
MDVEILRHELATCCGLAEYLGLFDFSGHASARIEGEEALLINSRDSVRSRIRLEDIIKVNMQGEPLGKGTKAPSEVYIHTSIYQRRPDVHAIAHLHSSAVIALSITAKEFVPVVGRSACFVSGVPVYDDTRTVTSKESGRILAETLGHRQAVILYGHGSVVVAESVKALLAYSLFLEGNARNQLIAYQVGAQPRSLRKEEIKEETLLYKQRLFEKIWDYYIFKADLKF